MCLETSIAISQNNMSAESDNIWTWILYFLGYFFFPISSHSFLLYFTQTSLEAQTVKHLPIMRETRVQPLGWKDPLEKEMATHSSILAWKIPWMVEPGRLQSMGSQRVGHNWATEQLHFHIIFSQSMIGNLMFKLFWCILLFHCLTTYNRPSYLSV